MMWRLMIILALLPISGDGPLNEAMKLFREGRYQESIQEFVAARDQYPSYSQQISYNMGLAYQELGQTDLARDAFFQSLSPLAPQTASRAANQIALQLLREGRAREALSFFREALLFDPEHENARYNYELLALRLGQNQPPKKGSPPPSSDNNQPQPEDNRPTSLDPQMQQLLQKLEQRQRRAVPPGDRKKEIGGDTLTIAEAYQVLELMRKQERQYIQQLRKISSISAEREGRPGW